MVLLVAPPVDLKSTFTEKMDRHTKTQWHMSHDFAQSVDRN